MHQEVLNFLCLPPRLRTAAQLHPRHTAHTSLQAVWLICRCSAAIFWLSSSPAWLLQLICCTSSRIGQVAEIWQIPPAKRMYPRKPGTQMQPLPGGDWRSDLQHRTSEYAQIQPYRSYRSNSNPSFPLNPEQALLPVSIRTFISVLKNRCHSQKTDVTTKIWASLFVFLNADGNKYTT